MIPILLWLFPLEPLRRLLGVKDPNLIGESADDDERKHDLTKAFKAILDNLEIVEDGEYFKRRAPIFSRARASSQDH